MKWTLIFTFVLSTLLLSFWFPELTQAQQQERPIVRLIYFLPSDRTPQPDFDTKMDALIKDVQELYANQMAAHGFGRKTFVFETDTRGKAVVHHVIGQFTEEHYNNLSYTTSGVFGEVNKRFDTSKDIYIIAIDTSLGRVVRDDVEFCGLGSGGSSGGTAIVPAAGDCFSARVVAHELGHVFGLSHGFYNDIDNKKVLSYTQDNMLASFWAADWWDVLPAFNPPRPSATNNERQSPTVKMLPPSLAAPPNVIRLRFEITDPNERLHQAQLIRLPSVDAVFCAGQRLSGKPSEIVEFITPQLTLRDQKVWLQMIDADGNITHSQHFPIDIAPLLPPSETFSTARLNKGNASEVAYSPDGLHLAVAGNLGVWIYDTKIDVPPVLIENIAVTSISFSPDGQTLAVGIWGQVVRLWDVRTGELTHAFELTTIPLDLSFNSDGRFLAIAGSNGTIYLWDVGIGEFHHTIVRAHSGNCNSVSFSPDGQTLASGGVDKTVRLWDVSTGKRHHELIEHTGWVKAVSFSPDGQTLASVGLEKDIRLWNVLTGEPRQTITTNSNWNWNVSFSPDGQTLASAGDYTVQLRDTESGELRHTLYGHAYSVLSVSFSPDSDTLASVSPQDSTVNIWDVMTGELHQTLPGYSGSIQSMLFSPDSETLATVGDGKATIDMWDVMTGELRHILTGHTDWVNTVSFSPDGQTLASGASDVRLWDVSIGELRHTFTGHASVVNIVSFSPDGKMLVSADDNLMRDKKITLRLWDVVTGELRHTLTGHTDRVNTVSFSPDGKTLASVSLSGKDQTIRIWDVMTGKLLDINPLIPSEGGWVIATPNAKNTAFSPDGKTFACVATESFESTTSTIYLWDVMTGKLHHTLHGHSDIVSEVSFSPDGKMLVSGSDDHTIRLWDVMTGELHHTLIGHAAWVLSVSFSPDGKTLASGSVDIRLWDVESGEFRHILTGHTNSVSPVLFSPDGQTLASAAGGTVRLWEVVPSLSKSEKIKEDLNADGIVNIQDLILVKASLGQTGDNPADINEDRIVDIRDLVLVAGAIGNAPAAPALTMEPTFTTKQVEQWLRQARRLNLTDSAFQRGILVLERLLAALMPGKTILLANYPNPFNPETWIPYQLSEPADVTLTICDIQGRVVRALDLGHQRAGIYQSKSRAAYWDGRNVQGEPIASGIYFYTFKAGDFIATRKMLIRK